ncbi:MAG TPA: cation:dicarboxylase symporter family transporter [Longimicrobiaceae bacterium]|nr:cation:dicarboxylase symporter family transporter [Longimicrobiaceae bacterium]
MSLTTRVLLGLVAGLGIGAWIAAAGTPALREAALWVEPLGTLWTRAIQMTVVPLVVSLLFAGVAAGGAGIGRIGARALVLFLVLLAAAAALALALAPPLLGMVGIDPAAAAALRGATSPVEAAVPTFAEWLVGLIPSNPVRAAADGAMLPLIFATLLFAAAARRAAPERRDLLVRVAEAVSDATLVLVRWILALAPLGVFALALPLAARLGIAALGAVAAYVGLTVAACVLVIAALYPLAALGGRVRIGEFARAAAPAQAVAFSARSSLAALPPMIEGARALRLPREIGSFFLPLSASVFRLGGAIALPAGVLFIARLYGVELAPAQLVTVGISSILLTFSVPGIPGGSILIMAPILLAVGLPVEGIGILLGVDTIPDMFRTTTNVTGHMAAATLLGRRRGADVPDAADA